ncbi:transcriptional dual regulator [Buchnera aphidicola str. Ak (Acyrthosiphon kondoi)]|uniref:HTH-type transcriptional regulator MetR n=1 Tax=Buchnera aphidicola str. Ak (Acyrthosiphon kondoi) TaxID=1005090 RepID=G2LMB3_9GAMM|nr:HTH-type transcriptional regulator MetR [Buchnera aphidicola]AEO08401.1 transcriptional dual regulator [Buchnera aphidicola str. Ak (Acyrthosiphon kondoi)]WAI18242.1 MAG: HTH-type transcriptional regulator MetR [Buchnera aphidicola (Acyrthosiphon caraganae)]
MIEIKHLRTLQALKNNGSLSAAAIQLHQTQSAISHQCNQLEKKIGFKLFIRKSNPIIFTIQGKILLQLSEEILPKIQKAIKSCADSHHAIVRLAIECHSCIQWLTPALEVFQKKYSKVKIDFYSDMTFSPQPFLQQGKLDIVLTSEVLPRSNLFYVPMFDFEVRLVLSPKHPLVLKKHNITPEDLASEILMTYPVQRNRLDIWKHFLQPSGIIPIFKNVNNTLLLIQMVSAQMGIAALPHWVVDNFERQGLIVTKRIGNGIWGRLYTAIRNGEQKEKVIQDFIHSICLHASTHLQFIRNVFKK